MISPHTNTGGHLAGEALMVEADFAGVVEALEEQGYLVLDPHAIPEPMIDMLSSDLALRDDYNPNEVPVADWPRIRDRYRGQALKLLESAIEHAKTVKAPHVELWGTNGS